MIWFAEQGFDLENLWFDLDLIWNFVIWFKIIPNHQFFLHNAMLLLVIDRRRRPCFVLTPLSFSNSTVILISRTDNYERMQNNCVFARFDSYYVNWTFSKKLTLWWNWFVIWFDLDLKWFGFDLIIYDLIFDLRFWLKSFLPMICDFDLWFDLWFVHHWCKHISVIYYVINLR